MVELWLDGYRAAGASPGTIRVRGSHLRRFAARVDLCAATDADVVAFLASLPHLRPESRKSVQASLRCFYRWALIRGYVDRDPTICLRDVTVPPSVPHPITANALRAALLADDDETTLMILLGAYAGLRRAEIAAVHSGDVESSVLRVTGKGGRTRRVPVHPLLACRLSAVHGWAFASPVRPGRHVSPDYVADRLERVLPPPFTCHSLRHYFATAAYRGTHDLRAVQQLLGHSRPETTARYTLIDDDALTAAVLAVA
jgi:integrase/recombinase XerC